MVFLMIGFVHGQTDQGSFLIEANTGFGEQVAHGSNTSFRLISYDGNTEFAFGAEAGYFIKDDLALKVGLGYDDANSAFTYKVGAKYYFLSSIPVQLDIAGASIKDNTENPLWLGAQAGYAIFLNENVSIEPGVRYNYSLNQNYADIGVLEFNIGFVIFL